MKVKVSKIIIRIMRFMKMIDDNKVKVNFNGYICF